MGNAVKQAEGARKKAAEFDLAANLAEQQSAEAKARFESAPSAETHTAFAVAEQVAKNARKDATAYAQGIAQLLADAEREQRSKELDSAIASVKGESFEKARQRLEDLVADFRVALRGGLVDLHDAIAQHNANVATANNLAEGLGRPERFSPRTVDDVIEAVALVVNGGVRDAIGAARAVNLKTFTMDGDERSRRFLIEINEPLKK